MGKRKKGIEFLATYEVGKIREDQQIIQFAIPSKFRRYDIKELYEKVLILHPEYKGKYAFAYSEIGRGIDIGLSIDVLKVMLSPLFPIHLEAQIKGGFDKLNEQVLLLSRPHQRKQKAHSDAPVELLTNSPLCLQSLEGRKVNLRIEVSASASIKVYPPISIGNGNLTFKIAETSVSFSGKTSSYYLRDKSPGWYTHRYSDYLLKDIDNLISSGQKKQLKNEIVSWLREHISKNILKKLIKHKTDQPEKWNPILEKLKELDFTINQLPHRSFKERIVDKKFPFKNPSSEEILEKIIEVESKFIEVFEVIPGWHFGKNGKEEILNQIKWYREKLENSKKLDFYSEEFNRFPVKFGSVKLRENDPALENLSFAKLVVYGPFQFKLEADLLSNILKPDLEEEELEENNNAEVDEEEKGISFTPTYSDIPVKVVKKASRKLGLEKVNISFNGRCLLNKSFANSRYQAYSISKKNKIVFTQDTKISYLNHQVELGADFFVKLGKNNPVESEILDNYILNEDGSLKKEVVKAAKLVYAETVRDLKELTEKVKLQKTISINANKMEYNSISAYWIYPNDNTTEEVILKEGSGISFGFSIQVDELLSAVNGIKNPPKSPQRMLVLNSRINRIATLLKLNTGYVKTFLEKLDKVINKNKSRWHRIKKDGLEILLESAFIFRDEVKVKVESEKKKPIHTIEKLRKSEALKKFFDTANGRKIRYSKLKPESIRLRYRLADSLIDDDKFKLGVDVGFGISMEIKRYKRAGNEAIQDYLIYTIPNKQFYYRHFPAEFLDRTVPPVMLLPHSFPEPE